MKSIKITPLNIISAAAFLAIALLIADMAEFLTFRVSEMKTLFIILFFMLAVVAFVADLIFRKMIPSVKRLWFIELSLITLTIVIAIVLKSIL